MPYDPHKHHRRSIRLKGYDYTQPGSYFITICTHHRQRLFGEVRDGRMHLNKFGHIVQKSWQKLPNHYCHIRLGPFVIMPNHVHFILILVEGLIKGHKDHIGQKKRHGVPEIVRGFKTFSAKEINRYRDLVQLPVWQRNYYEHIIRNDRSYLALQTYIEQNPLNWLQDIDNV